MVGRLSRRQAKLLPTGPSKMGKKRTPVIEREREEGGKNFGHPKNVAASPRNSCLVLRGGDSGDRVFFLSEEKLRALAPTEGMRELGREEVSFFFHIECISTLSKRCQLLSAPSRGFRIPVNESGGAKDRKLMEYFFIFG